MRIGPFVHVQRGKLDRAGAQLADSTCVRVGVLDVVEVTEREDDVEGTGERRREEVALYELGLAVEPCQALPGEVEHRVRQVDVDVAGSPLLEDGFADPP